jgi:predicted RNase H-like HicB family nuclease
MHTVNFAITYTSDEGGYNALEPITGTTTWGETLEEARAVIIEALELYFEEVAAEEIPQTNGVVFGSVAVQTEDAA